MTSIEALNEFEQQIVGNVREHGCHINFVFSAEEDEDQGPGFAYSVGFLETVDQPEVIIFGLPPDLMHFMINQTLERCREGFALTEGGKIDWLLEGYDVIARSVAPETIVPDYLASAIWFEHWRTGKELDRVMQLVWPDMDGRYPWDEGVDPSAAAEQSPLYERNLSA